ncbi:MAG TPA: cupin domain-containing protein [Actinomycetota bacterium]|nr:cupin domain-containing protein [Actinomycetota bacterium]
MSFDQAIRVVKATEHEDLGWEVIPTPADDPTPPGEEVVSFRSGDRRFSFGIWRRAAETGPMELPYHEIAVIIEGEVEIEEPDGTVHRVGPGDVLITPKGSTATWRALTPVKKFWAVHQED